MRSLLNAYFALFNFLTKDALASRKYESFQAHCHLAILFSTGLCMWAYAYVAHQFISDPLPGFIGYSMSTLHLLSLFFLLWPGNIQLAIHTLIGAGFIHQTCFAFYTGGIQSNIPIWYSLLPILGGIILGKKGALTWFFITITALLVFLIMELTDHAAPNLISDTGWFYSQLLITFGWIGISTGLIILYNFLREKDLESLNSVNKRVRSLLLILSHDLTHPLNVLKTKVQKIKEPSLSQSMASPITAMEETLTLVRQWEAIQAGKISLEEEEVNLGNIILDLAKMYDDKLLKKQIQLNIALGEKPLFVKGDKAILQNQVFSNLLSNAIKFTPSKKSIHLTFKEDAKTLEIHVIDEGIGVSPDIEKDLFHLNKKTTRKGTHGEGGTGLGLPIVKTYLEKMGGSLSFSSNETQGTTFIVKLRRA